MDPSARYIRQDGRSDAAQRVGTSRYALRVGEIDVLVISYGVLPLPFATMSTDVDPAERRAWLVNLLRRALSRNDVRRSLSEGSCSLSLVTLYCRVGQAHL